MRNRFLIDKARLPISILLIFIAVAVATIPIIVSQRLHKKMVVEERAKMELWASSVEALASEEEEAPLNVLLGVISSNTTIPAILCNEQDSILSFNNLTLSNSPDTTAQLQCELTEFKEQYPPIVIDLGEKGRQYLYYSHSSTLQDLFLFPSIQILVFIFFLIILFVAVYYAMKSSQSKLWIGLSKETAHQLGTPISSLMAWVEILRAESADPQPFDEMAKDTERLKTIANRFQKIGSETESEQCLLGDELSRVVHYMQQRVSQGVSIELLLPSEEISVLLVPALWSWVFENLIKNSVDAMEGRGKIEISVERKGRFAVIDCSDTGRGIPSRNRRKIFNAGFTTKRNGWGIGLSLVRRIVEEYHQGKIMLLKSEVGEGATFRIKVPIKE